MNHRSPSILFQLLWANYDTPAAVNIWVKNLAKAYMQAKICPTIQYLSWNSRQPKYYSGVEYIGTSGVNRILANTPKIKRISAIIIQLNEIKNSKTQYSIISPFGAPYTVYNEMRRNKAIANHGAMHFHPILEDPSVRTGITDSRDMQSYVRSVANIYDVLFPITTYLKKLYEENGRTKPTLLNPIIVDTEKLRIPVKRSDWNNPKLVYTGNLNHGEEMMLLLTSFASVAKHMKACRLEIIGGCTTSAQTRKMVEKYQAICKELEIFDSTEFLGVLPHRDVMERYADADAFLLPRPFMTYSRAGFPSKLGEYLMAGKPVITTATGDIPLYLEDGVSAYLVDNGSPDAFAEQVLRCIKDSTSMQIGLRGREVAEESFSVQATAKRIEAFFLEYGLYEQN